MKQADGWMWIRSQGVVGNAWLADKRHMAHLAHTAAALDEESARCLKALISKDPSKRKRLQWS